MRVLVPELAEDEDERIRKFLINLVSTMNWRVDWPEDKTEEEKVKCLAWLEKQKEQKPRLIGENSVEKKARQMYETGQTIEEQKPAEWREEDEKLYRDALTGLKYAYEDLSNHKSFDSAKKVGDAFDWLKSLRPRPQGCMGIKGDPDPAGVWKPSEEQMEAFEDVLEAINTKTNLGRLHLYQQGALGRLYQDLKKL